MKSAPKKSKGRVRRNEAREEKGTKKRRAKLVPTATVVSCIVVLLSWLGG